MQILPGRLLLLRSPPHQQGWVKLFHRSGSILPAPVLQPPTQSLPPTSFCFNHVKLLGIKSHIAFAHTDPTTTRPYLTQTPSRLFLPRQPHLPTLWDGSFTSYLLPPQAVCEHCCIRFSFCRPRAQHEGIQAGWTKLSSSHKSNNS